MNQLTGFQRDALYVIAGHEAPKGVIVKDGLEDYYEDEVNHGRLYPNLTELAGMGLVSKGQKDDRTNEYRLTDAGREVLEARREWEDGLVEL